MAVPSSSVTVTGKAGAGDGLAVGVGATVAVGAAVGTTAAALGDGDVVAAPAHAAGNRARTTNRARSVPPDATGRTGRAGIRLKPPNGGRRGRDESRNPSIRAGRTRGLTERAHGSCLPFSRRFEHAPCGRRPDSRSRRGAHRSGTVPGSHRLRDHTAFGEWHGITAPIEEGAVVRASERGERSGRR